MGYGDLRKVLRPELTKLNTAPDVCLSSRLFVLETRNPYQSLIIPFPDLDRSPLAKLRGNGLRTVTNVTETIGLQRSIQAAALLDRVLTRMRENQDTAMRAESALALDLDLQSLMGSLLEQSKGERESCAAISITLK